MGCADAIKQAFEHAMMDFSASQSVQALLSGRITVAHYQSLLTEVFHYSREDPQLQGLATVYFRGNDRSCIKMFFKHATSEIGHDAMALEDLKRLGVDITQIPVTNPLPATTALTAFPFFQIQYRRAVGYLGYLYFLEHMPTSQGAIYAEAFQRAGVPKEAMGFLSEHTAVDVAHNKLMDAYVERLVRTEVDLREVIYAMRVTGYLYAEMVIRAFRRADHPETFGRNPCEEERVGGLLHV